MQTRIGLLLAASLASPAFGGEDGVRAIGTLEPEEVIDVGAEVAGTVLKLGADPADPKKVIDFNTRVEEGTVLVQIDPERCKIAVEKARAALELARSQVKLKAAHLQVAEKNWERCQKLPPARAVSQEEVDLARGRLEIAKAELAVAQAGVPQAEAVLKEAELDLGRTTIRSPVKGLVIDRRVNIGQTVVASLNAPSLFLIAKDLKRMEVWAAVDEADIGQVRTGQTAQFKVAASPDKTFEAKVTQVRLNATLDKRKVTYTVVLAVDNADGSLLPYMTANVRILTGKR